MVGLAARRLGPDGLAVHPSPSSIALAAARLALPWDDLVVASVRGEPLEHVVRTVVDHPAVAVLVSRHVPPQAVGEGCGGVRIAVDQEDAFRRRSRGIGSRGICPAG